MRAAPLRPCPGSRARPALALALALLLGAALPAAAHDGAAHAAPAARPQAGASVPPLPAPGSSESPAARDEQARRYFTDTVLQDQDGKAVRFYADVLRDRLVLLNFVYTDCGEACPLITQHLVTVKEALGADFGREVRFVSISLDPRRDTPEALRKFAARFGALHPEWRFLGGEPQRVAQVLRRLGGHTDDLEAHNTALIAGNLRTGHWRRFRPDTPAAVLAAQLRRMAGEDRRWAPAPP